jgi:hypothetical protein
VIPLHFEGWTHFTQGADELRAAFAGHGIARRLTVPERGATIAVSKARSAGVLGVREAVLEFANAIEELAHQNGAGVVEAEVTPQALRFGQPRSAGGREQRSFACARTGIKESEGEIASGQRDPDSSLSGEHRQLDRLPGDRVGRWSRRRSPGVHRPPPRGSKCEADASFS